MHNNLYSIRKNPRAANNQHAYEQREKQQSHHRLDALAIQQNQDGKQERYRQLIKLLSFCFQRLSDQLDFLVPSSKNGTIRVFVVAPAVYRSEDFTFIKSRFKNYFFKISSYASIVNTIKNAAFCTKEGRDYSMARCKLLQRPSE